MEAVVIVLFVVFAISISIFQRKSYERKIMEQINSIGGEVTSIERKTFSGGPFFIVGRRGRTIYRIEYRKDNKIREGWVKFGGLFGPDWKL
jgi:hypothetical protein